MPIYSLNKDIETAKPLIDDWAREVGVNIQFYHAWYTDDDWHHVTAFGYSNEWTHNDIQEPQTYTVNWRPEGMRSA